MIADKMKNLVNNSSVIRAMFEEGKLMAKERGADNVYDFSLGNPSVEPPKMVKEAIIITVIAVIILIIKIYIITQPRMDSGNSNRCTDF